MYKDATDEEYIDKLGDFLYNIETEGFDLVLFCVKIATKEEDLAHIEYLVEVTSDLLGQGALQKFRFVFNNVSTEDSISHEDIL